MVLLIQVAAALAAVPVTFALAPPASYPEAFSGLGVLDTTGPWGGLNGMTGVSHTITQWPWGTVPKRCYERATQDGYCNIYDVEVYDVMYDDCSVPWRVCRCNNSPFPIANIASRWGTIPVGARQYVRYLMSWPGGGNAYSNSDDIAFFGDFTNSNSVFIHETTHSLDKFVGGGGTSAYSITTAWNDVILSDSCVPDSYSKASNTEDYAQNGVLVAYDWNVDDIFTVAPHCLENQFYTVADQLGPSWEYVEGKQCTTRVSEANSPTVCMGDVARDQGACNGVDNGRRRPEEDSWDVPVAVLNLSPEQEAKIEELEAERKLEAEIREGIRSA